MKFLDDKDLINKIAKADRKAFATLYMLFKDRVFTTAFSYLRLTEDAEELTQDVFVEISRSAKFFDVRSSVSTWIYKITVNKSLDKLRYIRAKKRFSFLPSMLKEDRDDSLKNNIPDTTHHGLEADKKESLAILLAAIDRLPANQKTALILTQLEYLKGKEAAEIMGVSAKAIEGLIQRAKSNLRKELEKIYNRQGK
ncbi:MAG: RNA polymerase sigma factor [Sphingobacteriaceae bacterium]|nr:RNA polymerase sigma factor [Sphingobacteriaceae bacterium]